ncbi:hypothetical protein BCU70_21375 [Vibrio sp. 10N.286.49.C2]|uniref:glycosyltransferase family 4 protein n=1 Tax=unclassified Vibrio TaxID=2614977 RepID=UPI000C8184B7|nr:MULTISPECIES: glycosyltransferase family 4 protein [unclassified Vibrio]PMH32132.1 hypothetical protein BCU70_21375 [Vibrio sp. 10N.286.49.C2]PMH47973.1 hypothetical protein BCU66_21730 [Vibrio sp. 10N.286.49.B1]
MKILWVVNLVLPKVAHLVNVEKIPFGGWVTNMLDLLVSRQELDISVVMRADVKVRLKKEIDGITYLVLPLNKYNKFDVEQKDAIWALEETNPDLLHIEGSESAHAARFLNIWTGKNVVSMQGILNGYEQYEVPKLPIYSRNTMSILNNALDVFSLKANKLISFNKRLKVERETLSLAKNILGRTHWDKAHSYALNSIAPYFECSRILRSSFYSNNWEINCKKKYRVFIGNSAQARKGAHVVIDAIKFLVDEYPNIELVVAGLNPFEKKDLVGYRRYLKRKIKDNNLINRVRFTGIIQEDEMINILKSSHVFVMSSIIENSPNTLGEAMILGVPCITSYNGGVSDMAVDGVSALFYRATEPEVLAMRIKEIFDNDDLALSLSKAARKQAMLTHNPTKNADKLIYSYSEIIQGK